MSVQKDLLPFKTLFRGRIYKSAQILSVQLIFFLFCIYQSNHNPGEDNETFPSP